MPAAVEHKPRRKSGERAFTLVEILIVVAIVGILLSIAAPRFVKARDNAAAKACQGNLSQILSAKERWAMDNNRSALDTPAVADLTSGYLATVPECQTGGDYVVGRMDQLPTCSIGGVRGEVAAHVLP